jgi:integrase
MALTDTRIRKAKAGKTPRKLTDDRGLYIEVRPTGAKLWRYRYRIAGKENVFALGEYPEIGLAQAREDRDAARKLVKQGIHPAHSRAEAKAAQVAANADTFQAVATRWLAEKRKTWVPSTALHAERALQAGLFPYIGNAPVRTVTPARLLELLRQSEKQSGPTSARQLRQLASQVFRFAIVNQCGGDTDPAMLLKGAIHALPTRHRKPLSRDRIKALCGALGKYVGTLETIIAMKLLLMLFVRTMELREAEWSEFDLDAAEWRIPAARMKMREPHFVPLSAQAVALLRELHHRTGRGRYLFPNTRRRDACMAATTLNVALGRMGFGGEFSAHGFRATASTLLNEMGYRPDVIERQLAHKPKDAVRSAYNQAEYLDDRRQMMQQWADVVDQLAKGDKKVLTGRFSKVA